jgi:hypothetical protein
MESAGNPSRGELRSRLLGAIISVYLTVQHSTYSTIASDTREPAFSDVGLARGVTAGGTLVATLSGSYRSYPCHQRTAQRETVHFTYRLVYKIVATTFLHHVSLFDTSTLAQQCRFYLARHKIGFSEPIQSTKVRFSQLMRTLGVSAHLHSRKESWFPWNIFCDTPCRAFSLTYSFQYSVVLVQR